MKSKKLKPIHPLNALEKQPKTLVELFNDKRRWCKDASAKNAKKQCVDVTSYDAVSFCLSGAASRLNLSKVKINRLNKAATMLHRIKTGKFETSYISVNDDRKTTFQDIQIIVKAANV